MEGNKFTLFLHFGKLYSICQQHQICYYKNVRPDNRSILFPKVGKYFQPKPSPYISTLPVITKIWGKWWSDQDRTILYISKFVECGWLSPSKTYRFQAICPGHTGNAILLEHTTGWMLHHGSSACLSCHQTAYSLVAKSHSVNSPVSYMIFEIIWIYLEAKHCIKLNFGFTL